MKKTRMFLSIAAVMFAVAGAVATDSFGNSRLVDPDVAKQGESGCLVRGKCTNGGGSDCMVGAQTYALISGGTCGNAATGTFYIPD